MTFEILASKIIELTSTDTEDVFKDVTKEKNDLESEVATTVDDNNNSALDNSCNNKVVELENEKENTDDDTLKNKFEILAEVQNLLVNKVRGSFKDIAKDEWLEAASNQSSN